MNWDSIREGELKEVFDILQETFAALGIDYYLIGAVARNIWYAREKKTYRETKDVDFAVFEGAGDLRQWAGGLYVCNLSDYNRGLADIERRYFEELSTRQALDRFMQLSPSDSLQLK